MITVSVRYFAILREQRGLEQEMLVTSSATPSQVYEELRQRHGFTLPGNRIRAAVNGAFVPLDFALQPGAELAFIPPVAGG